MSEIELLLSEEYIAFSAKIAEIYNAKKIAKDEFKKKYEEFQNYVKTLDHDAGVALEEFESWKSQQKAMAKEEKKQK